MVGVDQTRSDLASLLLRNDVACVRRTQSDSVLYCTTSNFSGSFKCNNSKNMPLRVFDKVIQADVCIEFRGIYRDRQARGESMRYIAVVCFFKRKVLFPQPPFNIHISKYVSRRPAAAVVVRRPGWFLQNLILAPPRT